MSQLLESLNEEQLQAATHVEGPLMIVAGAGTGKTTVITRRIAWLIEQGYAKPDQILALTFTEKAATEMEERIDKLLPFGYVDLWISTFHAFCERILRQNAIDIGLPHEFRLFTEVDAMLLIRKKFDVFNFDYYKPRGNPTRFIKAFLQHISRLKDEMITPEAYIAFAEEQLAQVPNLPEDEQEGAKVEGDRIMELAQAYKRYQELLLEEVAFDFGDLLQYTIELLQKRPRILKEYQKQFRFILVDEFQDTNTAQYVLVKLLINDQQNITIVGDDDQSIYKFRGASLANIMQFKKDFPEARAVVLVHNYRSTPAVLNNAYTLITQNNPHRLEVQENINKELISHREEEGFVEYIACQNAEEEVSTVVKKIADLRKEGAHWSDMAILVRANAAADPFVDAFDRSHIPYRFFALSGLYVSPIILDTMAWMHVVDQPHTSPSLYRVLSHPRLGISEDDIARINLYCHRKAMSIYDALQMIASIDGVSEEAYARVKEILETMQSLRTKARRMPVSELFVAVIKESGMYGDVLQYPEYEQMELFGLLNQFHKRIKRYEENTADKTIGGFMEELDHERSAGEMGALAQDSEAGPDVINIMTVHASKGLEFKYVFLVNLIEQRFPSIRRSETIPFPEGLTEDTSVEDDPHIAEERRLFYVALTRAKEGAFLLAAEDYGGSRKRKPSRFLQDLGLTPKPGVRSGVEEEEIDGAVKRVLSYKLPERISFTQLAAFNTCPQQYKFGHILHVPIFGKHQMSFGKSVHNTLEKITKEIEEARKERAENPESTRPLLPTEEVLLNTYEDEWIDDWYPSIEERKEYKDKGREQLLAVYKDWQEVTPPVAFVESPFTLKIGSIVIKGRIDRIDETEDGYEIVDYKTGKPKTRLSWDDKKQLVLYQLAAESCFDPPLKISRLTYHYMEDNTRVSFEAKEKEKEKLEQQILDTVDLIKQSAFEATPGFPCQYCDFRDICEFAE